ncbi:MAG: type III pantothenate kinase [Nitrospirales bacterium]|nr:type III pantothenate kinase [Nitrospirales bacterium]
MLLTVDVGNSQIVLGVFDQEKLRGSWRLATDVTKTADEYGVLVLSLLHTIEIHPPDIHGCIISSVVPPMTPIFECVSETYFQQSPLLVSSDFPFGLTLQYDNPQEIGTDRLVNAAAAYHRFHNELVVVDFGTATTFCTVTKDGEYLGGAIAPGLKSAANALHINTAKLPTVDLLCPPTVIGKDTVSSIQSGLIFGYTGLVDELVSRIQQETGQTSTVLATGGQASIIAPISRTIHEVRPFLTLEGLELLYRRVKDSQSQ